MIKQIIIVVPIYKTELSKFEIISIKQLFRILGGYTICFIVPESLAIPEIISQNKGTIVYRFNDYYFKSTSSYNELCMFDGFYKTFSEYEYMLIYQTDAFCFSDRLMEFYSKGYDFIGAPTPKCIWGKKFNHVGNGGFSLRRIESFIRVLNRKKEVFSYISSIYPEVDSYSLYTEDHFFSICSSLKDMEFRTPNVREAYSFSVEYNIDGIYIDIENNLPFGCHRWPYYKYKTWKRIIESYGYELDDKEMSYKEDNLYNYRVIMALLESGRNEKIYEMLRKYIFWDDIVLWGYGKVGKRCMAILESYGYSVSAWDQKAEYIDDDNVFCVTQEKIKNRFYPVIVTVIDSYEIEEKLCKCGKTKDKDYYLWTDIIRKIGDEIDVDKYGEYPYFDN